MPEEQESLEQTLKKEGFIFIGAIGSAEFVENEVWDTEANSNCCHWDDKGVPASKVGARTELVINHTLDSLRNCSEIRLVNLAKLCPQDYKIKQGVYFVYVKK